MNNCQKCVFFEAKKKKDLFMWYAAFPFVGASIREMTVVRALFLFFRSHQHLDWGWDPVNDSTSLVDVRRYLATHKFCTSYWAAFRTEWTTGPLASCRSFGNSQCSSSPDKPLFCDCVTSLTYPPQFSWVHTLPLLVHCVYSMLR